MAPVDDALALLVELEYELSRRRPEIEKLTEYYDGKQPLKFATAQYRDWFGNLYQGFADNWCAPVADATSERLKVAGVRARDAAKADDELRRWWEESGAPADSSLAFSTAAVTRRAYALVWGSDDGNPEVTFEHPSQAIVSYEPGSRRRRRAALKLWAAEGKDFATLYTADTVWKFQRRASRNNSGATSNLILPDTAVGHWLGGWEQRQPAEDDTWPIPNPIGTVPMVELQHRPKLLGEPLSEITGVIAMQDAINALWAYLFTAADFSALPQRVILGAQLPKMPILDSEGNVTGWKPIDLPEANVKRILNLEGPDAKIGQWDSAKLDTFTGVIEHAANHIGNQTRTPLYYFASSIQNISGDTLKALETGLISKVGEVQTYHGDPVREIFRLMYLAAGNTAKAEAIAAGTVLWADHESRSEAQKVDALTKLGQLGFPFEYLVEQYTGGDADEVARIMAMRKREAATDPLSLLAQRERTRNGADQDGEGGPPRASSPAA